jgi:signal transduction histidine kinase
MKIRLRLTLIFTLLVGLFLISFSFVIYYKAYYDRLFGFYEQIEIRALTAAIMVLEEDELPAVDIKRASDLMKIKLAEEYIYIVDTNYNVVFRSEDTIINVDKVSVDVAMELGISKDLRNDTQHLFLRYWDDGQDYVIAAQAYDNIGLDYLADLRFILIIGCLLAPALIFGAGWWFTSNMFKPVKQMTLFAARITEKNLHQRIIENKNNDELTILARTFNKMLERIDNAFNREKDLISYASHELRTPITAIQGNLEVSLSKIRDNDEYVDTLKSIYDDVVMLNETTDKLLSLAKAGYRADNINYKDVVLDELITSTTEELLERYPGRIVNFKFNEVLDIELIIRGSYSLLKSAILNVIDNALKYSQADKSVDIVLKNELNNVVVEIIDYGYGIDKEDLGNVFLPFFRSDKTKNISGHGVGLALAESVINNHGGKITIESEIGVGTLVKMSIPKQVPKFL